MQQSGAFDYKFPEDDTSDDSSSSSSSSSSSNSSSGSSTVSKKQQQVKKCEMVAATKSSKSSDLSLLINRLKRDVPRKNSLGEEFSSESCSSVESKEDVEEEEGSIKTDSDENNFEDSVSHNLGSSDNESMVGELYRLGAAATPQQIASWMRCNGFENFVEIFDGFSYYDLRRLTRTDLIDICGAIRGIQMYNAIQMKPVLPLRTVYCAEEQPNDKGINWRGVYLHSLNAKEFDAQIIARFNLPPRKHSLWMEGPYGINILINNETVEYMEDNDMFLIQLVEYPSVEHYKIILKRYM